MEDGEIIELYWRRDEAAIAQSEKKYGAYCRAVICRILQLPEDVEECLVDTWMAAWNAMPPQRPTVLRTFLGGSAAICPSIARCMIKRASAAAGR